MTTQEIHGFFQAIDRKQASFFGLVKLRKLNLNALLDVPEWCLATSKNQQHVPRQPRPPEQAPDAGHRRRTTLLEFAALHPSNKTDAIVSALLRGGANPRTREESGGDASLKQNNLDQSPQQYLASFYLQYGVFIVKRLVHMRQRGEALLAARLAARLEQPQPQPQSPPPPEANISCSLCSISPAVNPLCSPCQLHLVCEDCCWNHMQQIDPQCNEEAIDYCAKCHSSTLSTPPTSAFSSSSSSSSSTSSTSSSPTNWNPLPMGSNIRVHQLKLLDITSATNALLSFHTLPKDLTRLQMGTASKKQKRQGKLTMVAMSKQQLRQTYVGTTQPKRTEQLWKTADEGNYLRLIELLKVGVNVNAVDENGECAAYRAAAVLVERGNLDDLQRLQELLLLEGGGGGGGGGGQKTAADDSEMSLTTHGCVVYLLFLAGADLTLRTHEGYTLRDLLTHFIAPTPSPPLLPLSSPIVTTLIPSNADHSGAGSYYIDGLFNESFLVSLDELFHSIPHPNDTNDAQQGHSTSTGKQTNNTRNYSNTCAKRKFFRARVSNVVPILQQRLARAFAEATTKGTVAGSGAGEPAPPTHPIPRLRFLLYDAVGGEMRPHVDLSKTYKERGRGSDGGSVEHVHESTHTFLLHLRDSEEQDGGETVLLDTLHKSRKKESKKKNKKNKTEAQEKGVGEKKTSGEQGSDGMPLVLGTVRPKRGRLMMFPHVCPHAGLMVHSPNKKLFLRGELYRKGST
jgi:hypothetical protein